MVTVPHIMVVLERMLQLDYRGVGLARYRCTVHFNGLFSGLNILYSAA